MEQVLLKVGCGLHAKRRSCARVCGARAREVCRDGADAGGAEARRTRAVPVGVRAGLPPGAPFPKRLTFVIHRDFLFVCCGGQPGEGDAIVRWAAGFVNGGAGGVFVTYEQIHPHDAFGQVMDGLHTAQPELALALPPASIVALNSCTETGRS
jgi:hypothetical protein